MTLDFCYVNVAHGLGWDIGLRIFGPKCEAERVMCLMVDTPEGATYYAHMAHRLGPWPMNSPNPRVYNRDKTLFHYITLAKVSCLRVIRPLIHIAVNTKCYVNVAYGSGLCSEPMDQA